VLPNARITGRRIGVASHGRMEEVEIPGATCAARKTPNIFQDHPETPEVEISRATRQFVEECQLMGSLRHPHILQFLGVCFMPGLRFPTIGIIILTSSICHSCSSSPLKYHVPCGSPMWSADKGLKSCPILCTEWDKGDSPVLSSVVSLVHLEDK